MKTPSDPGDPAAEVANAVDGAVHGAVVQAGSITELSVHVHHDQPAKTIAPLPYRAGVVPPRAAAFQSRLTELRDQGTVEGGSTLVVSGGGGVSIVSGLGGVGKTQLAVDYAESLWEAGEIDLLVWITAGSGEAVLSSYARLAQELTGTVETNPALSASRLLEWLAITPARWLVVLDDLQSPADLRGLWPPITATGRAVVTTRRRDAALRGYQRNLIEIGVFTAAEAHTYLHTALAEHIHLLDGVDDLAPDLGYLPLALAQAAAYMLDRNLSCAAYRKRLSDRRRTLASLLPEDEELPDEHRQTVAATLSLSIAQADRFAPRGLASPLLEIASLLDPNGIPVGVFSAAAVTTWLSTATDHPVTEDDVVDGLGCLHRLNLITFDPTTFTQEIRVHPLVQRVTRDARTASTPDRLAWVVADALLQIWPETELDTRVGEVLRTCANALRRVCEQHFWRQQAHPVLFHA